MAGLANWLIQVWAVTGFGLRSIPARRGAALSAVVGVAGVVAVMVGVLSISRGVRRMVDSSGGDGNAIVLRSGADSEMMSGLAGDDTRVIAEAPGIAWSASGALASPELFVVINLPKAGTGTDANVPMRGVVPAALEVRERFRIVEGRSLEWGRSELMVGVGAAREFRGLRVGDVLEVGQERWPVVGHFEAGGGIAESEIWCDAAVLQSAYRRGNSYQAVYARLASPESFETFKDALTSDPRLNVKVMREREFHAEQSSLLRNIVTGLGSLIAILMGLGAVFGALNTMYTAVAARTREIATLRALGFQAGPVVLSVLFESLLLALLGGVLGAAVAYLAFDGFQAATINWQSFSQIAFSFEVDLPLLVRGIAYALIIGLVGGLLPAVRAARVPIAAALREG